jgi:hypothetical protein
VPGNVVFENRRLAGSERARNVCETCQTIDVGKNGIRRNPE